jgi:zearalenone synthase (highly reducing iterative type I polyketide synthase)
LKGTEQDDSLDFNFVKHVKTIPGVSILSYFSDVNCYLARKNNQKSPLKDDAIVIIEPRETSAEIIEVSHQLSTTLINQGLQVDTVQWSSENTSNLHGKYLISLLELDTPFLSDLSEENYSLLKSGVLNSSRLLWVSRGSDPAMQATIGYLRVLQNENVNLDLRYMLLEGHANCSPDDIASRVCALALAPTTDREYLEIDGRLCINRWLVDERLKHVMASDDDQQGDSTEAITLRDVAYSALTLRHSSNKQQNSCWFTVDDNQQSDLSADEVEVQVKAIAIK